MMSELYCGPLRRCPDARHDDPEHDKNLADKELGRSHARAFPPACRHQCPRAQPKTLRNGKLDGVSPWGPWQTLWGHWRSCHFKIRSGARDALCPAGRAGPLPWARLCHLLSPARTPSRRSKLTGAGARNRQVPASVLRPGYMQLGALFRGADFWPWRPRFACAALSARNRIMICRCELSTAEQSDKVSNPQRGKWLVKRSLKAGEGLFAGRTRKLPLATVNKCLCK